MHFHRTILPSLGAWLRGLRLQPLNPLQERRKTYTDGLAVFSVFVEILDRDMPPGEGHVKQGGTTTYTRGLRLSNSPVLVTVIGEVPLATARMVADSVRWVR